jgi:hypothetical protein
VLHLVYLEDHENDESGYYGDSAYADEYNSYPSPLAKVLGERPRLFFRRLGRMLTWHVGSGLFFRRFGRMLPWQDSLNGPRFGSFLLQT